MTKFLLDSGDPEEYKQIQELAKKNGNEIWGATTNPSLIAKKLAGKKVTLEKSFELQKQIVLEIIDIVPGAVSAEVYADQNTTAEEMTQQGIEISKWHKRITVKLPTTLEGFKARTELRRQSIPVNNTLVFSQQQVFAICLHEQIIQKTFGPTTEAYPPFISPFVGRLDDIGTDGMSFVENAMKIKKLFTLPLPQTELAIWMLEASVRSIEHLKKGLEANVELITAPAKAYQEWFNLPEEEKQRINTSAVNLRPVDLWEPSQHYFDIDSLEEFFELIESDTVSIKDTLTENGIIRFAKDWKEILA